MIQSLLDLDLNVLSGPILHFGQNYFLWNYNKTACDTGKHGPSVYGDWNFFRVLFVIFSCFTA